jgi:hypothetical protein
MKTNLYFAELTDTFAGEANYSWVTRFKVKAKSQRGAIQKLSREIGLNYRYDGVRYNSKSGATCIFIDEYDSQNHEHYLNLKVI